MTSKEIIEYVMNTPHNTNPAILESMIRNLQAKEGLGGAYDLIIVDGGGENITLLKGSYEVVMNKLKNLEIPHIILIEGFSIYEGAMDNIYMKYPYSIASSNLMIALGMVFQLVLITEFSIFFVKMEQQIIMKWINKFYYFLLR